MNCHCEEAVTDEAIWRRGAFLPPDCHGPPSSGLAMTFAVNFRYTTLGSRFAHSDWRDRDSTGPFIIRNVTFPP